jgi:hypothetical protein
MSGEPPINSLARFRKHPGRLVLEEYTHCEVPAGCGGVVLRWRNPLAAVPLTVTLYAPVRAACFLDGRPVVNGRLDLAPGRHALAVVLENADRAAGLLAFAALYQPGEHQRIPREAAEAGVQILSAGDGTWKYSLDAPASEAWKLTGFDDAGWQPLTAVPTPVLVNSAPGAWHLGRCAEAGAACLATGLAAGLTAERYGTVYVRKTFERPAPELPSGETRHGS